MEWCLVRSTAWLRVDEMVEGLVHHLDYQTGVRLVRKMESTRADQKAEGLVHHSVLLMERCLVEMTEM